MSHSSQSMDPSSVVDWFGSQVPVDDFVGRRVLVIVPDTTRTAPLPLLFGGVYRRIGPVAESIDVIVALGTHPAMSESAIGEMLGLGELEGSESIGLYNHEWDRPDRLKRIGTLTAEDTAALSGGLLSEDVAVEINSRIDDYDVLLVLGPVFPHEVVGFSGGNKYFFPGIAGAEILNFFHWLGALITNSQIIGKKQTPVREVVDRAAAMIEVERRCVSFVVGEDGGVLDLFYGTPESAWSSAAELSNRTHIRWKSHPFHTVLSCAPPMYDELWVAGKCMYKLEPVVADGGELIIYAPHLTEISVTHGELIKQVGYHVRDYFTSEPERFADIPRGVLAHSTHVRGGGRMVDGVEVPRISVTLATALSEEMCRSVNLGWRDPATIDVDSFADREDEGVLLVRRAGEYLHRLEEKLA
ncbi:MAG: lactate racemase domain-containing protein [Planctomycetota bacterium]|nr:lactate racemase domain-containing protein [Planctomycetota bacterium]